METYSRYLRRAGFTLIEILVSLVLLSVLVATVFPVISQQVSRGDPVKAARELVSIRTAIETFSLNVYPAFPGDLEDLVNHIRPGTSSDSTVKVTAYTSGDSLRWNGPYIDAAILSSAVAADTVFRTGYGAHVVNDLFLFDIDATAGGNPLSSAASAEFVAVKLLGLTEAQFEELNDLIDGEREADGNAGSQDNGQLRCPGTSACGSPAYYLAVPIRK